VAVLTNKGGQLSNGDLEGLQRLRDLSNRNTPKDAEPSADAPPAATGAAAAAAAAAASSSAGARGSITLAAREELDETEKPDPGVLKLMHVEMDLLWRHLGSITHLDAIQQIGLRMAHGSSPLAVTGHEAQRQKVKETVPKALEFMASAQVALGDSVTTSAQLEAAKFFAIRAVAEGCSTSLPSAMALRLFLSNASAEGLHGRCARGFEAMYSSAPLSAEMEQIAPFLGQLELALEALPSQRGTQFVGLNVPTPSGKLQEALNGDRGIGSFYPGGLIVWRGCASVTTDPMLAKERAMAGQGCALVLKIRSNSSRDVSAFSPAPDLGERLFLPRRRFRVAGVYPLEDQILRRGLAMAGGMHVVLESFEAPELNAVSGGSALSWEAACSRRAACVVLDEEEAAASNNFQQ